MRTHSIRVLLFVTLILAAAAATAHAAACLEVDQAHDTFGETDRAAALILLAAQFEAEGRAIAADGCDAPYRVSHVKLGDAIAVTLSGPEGRRQATALGMNDLPALYSQLVRALLGGLPVGSFRGVVDRTNVTVAQASPLRVQSDSVFYARLGYGAGPGSGGGPAMGFGVRRELDGFAIDVSFMNIQAQSRRDGYYTGGSSGSWLKLELLRYLNRTSDASAYWGGGASWGGVGVSSGGEYWSGSGLQAELTGGYEMLRASNIRMFVQADAVLPFYSATSVIYAWPPQAPASVSRRYAPSATVSFGLGWGKSGRGRQ